MFSFVFGVLQAVCAYIRPVKLQRLKSQTQRDIFIKVKTLPSFPKMANLKLQSISFASLSPSLFENLELQLCAELSSVRGVVLRHGSSAD